MTLFGFLAGETVFAVQGKDAAKIFNLCQKECIPYTNTAWDGESFLMCCAGRAVPRLLAVCRAQKIPLEVRKRSGIPEMFRRYKNRMGIFVGLFLSVAVFIMSRGVVWNISVEGNERLTEARILTLLAENGVEVGAPLKGLDTHVAENNILLAERDIAWITLNRKGTSIYVEVRETERPSPIKTGAANLVAGFDGKIERIEVYDGNVVVKPMDVVRKGELLVSGVYDVPMNGGIRTTRAVGEVFAKTTHEYCVEIPLKYEEKVYTGREWSEKILKIFAKDIKVFVNTGNVPSSCDIICYEDKLRFFGGRALPVGMHTKLYREYTYQTVTLDADTAMAYAFDSMEKKLMTLPRDAELLEKTFCFELTDEAYILNCRVTCVQNIAVTQEIEIEG